MRKTITTFLSLVSGLLMTVSGAGMMNPGTPISEYGAPAEDSYVSSAYQIIMTWDEQMVHFVDGATKSFVITDPNGINKTYNTIYLENQYSDVTEAQEVVFAFDYAYAQGEYKVSIPAGIVANENGDTNPSQEISFTYGWQMSAQTFEPAQSVYTVNGWTGETSIPPFYSSEEVADVTVGLGTTSEAIPVSLTGWGVITANNGGEDNIDISELISINDGKLKLDLSTLEDGTWTINVPEGFLQGYNEEKILHVNNGFTLKYIIVNNYSPLTDYTIISPAEGSYYVNGLGQMSVYFGEPFKVAEGAKAIISYNGENKDGDLSLGYDASNGFVLNVSVGGYEPGLYEVTIPSGSIKAGEYSNPEITAKYYVVKQIYDGYVVSPASNTMVSSEEMKRIVISYPDYSKITTFSTNPGVNIVVGDYEEEYELTIGNGLEISGNQIILTPTKPIEQKNYSITIDQNTFIMDNDFTNGYISFNYSVWNGMKPAKVLKGPNGISTYNVEIKLNWDNQTVNPTDDLGVKVSYGWFGDELDIPASALEIQDGKTLYLNLSEYLKDFLDEDSWNTGTEMNVTFPEGIVKNEAGLLNPEQSISFTLYQIWDGEIVASVYPAADNTIQIYWEGEANWINTDYNDPAKLYLNNGSNQIAIEDCGWGDPDYGYYSANGYIDDNWDKGPCVLVNVGDVPGSYTLLIPAGSFTIRDDNYLEFTNEKSTINYQINADGTITVGEISTNVEILDAEGMYRVFNLQGVNVLNTRNEAELMNLSNGVYIINGTKVMIRK